MIKNITAKLQHSGSQATAHTWSTKWVHWIAAGLLAFAAIANGEATGALFNTSAMQTEVYVGIALVVVYGYLWFWIRGSGGGSRLPADAPRWERRLAKLVHLTIYGSIAAALVSGFAMAWLAPTEVIVDAASHSIVEMTSTFSFIRDFHEFSSGVLGWAFGLHVCGALWHRVVRRDGVLQSISLFKRNSKG